MKTFLAIIGLAALVLTSNTQAQTPVYSAQTLWSTNGAVGAGIPAATAPVINAVIDCRRQASITLAITAQADTGVAAGNAVFVYSIDGTSYSPSTGTQTMVKTVAVTPLVASAVTVVTNLNTFGCGYMKFLYYTNDTGASVTNMVVKYGIKIQAP
jgi:hypothetical protein